MFNDFVSLRASHSSLVGKDIVTSFLQHQPWLELLLLSSCFGALLPRGLVF